MEQPAVAVWIAERGKRAVAGVTGRRPADATIPAVRLELRARHGGVKHFADFRSMSGELVACGFDVGDDQVQALGRAGRSRRYVGPELD